MDLSTIMGMGADTIGAILSNPHFQGSMQAFGGLVEAGIGGGMTYLSGGIAAPIGWPVMAHGLDQFFTGVQTAIAGEHRDTVSSYLLQQTGVSRENANFVNDSISVAGSAGGAAATRAAQLSVRYFRLPLQAREVNLLRLYRAVKSEELADIQRMGAFRNLGYAEGKYFTTSMKDSASYAR